MAEWLVGPIMDKIINTGFEFLQNQFTWQTDTKKELERLREIHPKITAVVSAASRAQIIDQNSAFNKWIWQLRDALDEADDLLDDFEYMKHHQQLDINKEDTKVRSYLINISNTAKRLCVGNEDPLKSKPNFKKLAEIVQKLDRISAELTTFLHLLENIKQEEREQQVELHKTRETGSLPKNDLIGRGENKEFVLRWLRQPSDVTTTSLYSNISLLSIVGHGGMGKTTLLQHVYQDEIRKEFDLRMWVCVSDNFDVKKVITDMLECLQKIRPSLETLDALQESLRSEVMSKKFLLVLDDLWDKEEEAVLRGKWGDVLAPLAYGGLGSKILITTRIDVVASMIVKVIRKKKEALRLEGLKENECLQLLTTHAFDDAENPNDHKKLTSIAGELVKKFYGSPLAAKVMGGVLNSSLDERHWRNVLNSSFDFNGSIIPSLKLGYMFLPKHLQNCFSFCSIFEQDHFFCKTTLVRMWIAAGFIQSSHNNEGDAPTLEDIGERYFNVLLKKSFFEVFYQNGFLKGYKIHDLLHELAQSVSKQECFGFVGDKKTVFLETPETVRHLCVKSENIELLKEMERFKNLRTLVITTCDNQGLVDALNEMFKVTRNIRMLHIINDKPIVMPENIGYLHRLRYLSIFSFKAEPLPRSISSLYHLQFIMFHSISINRFYDIFPRDMNNLSNLRYLKYPSIKFPGIGKLKSLQQLDSFRFQNENGYRIEEIQHMNELCILRMHNLASVRDAEEACKAKLYDKRKLMDLSLDWYNPRHGIEAGELDERVIDNLQPPNCLKSLLIVHYMGARSAIWMNEAHTINNIEKINLSHCFEWEILPPFGELPFLEVLSLRNMAKVKRFENKFHGNDMCSVFPSLKTLYLTNMEALVDWFDASVVNKALFPCLTTLELFDCPNLRELPYLPPNLKTLTINKIGWKTLNCCSISKSIPLQTLQVRNCPNITSISLAGEIDKLKRVTIKYCPNLISLGEAHHEDDATENCHLKLDQLNISDLSLLQMEPLRSCTSIRSLAIEKNNELVSFPLEAEQWLLQLNSSLSELEFMHLPSLQSLPSSMTSISSLKILLIFRLPRLQELPNLPPSLKELKIMECDPELMKRHKQFSSSN